MDGGLEYLDCNVPYFKLYLKAVVLLSLLTSVLLRVSLENDAFVVWEMFPGNNGALSESGEEEDFYFSDNDMI